MGLPGSVVPPGDDWISRKLRELQQQIDRLSAARSAESTAIGEGGIRSSDFDGTGLADPGSMGWMIGREGASSYLIMNGQLVITGDTSIDGLLDIVGRLNVTGPTTLGGATEVSGDLDVTGPATIGGALTVTGDAVFSGDLAVPNGSITNDALASPLVIVTATPVTVTGWTVGTSHAAKATTSITVPAGFSRAAVVARANMHFQDSSPNGGYVRATIAGNSGAEMGGLANLNVGQSADHTFSLTGLTDGATITVTCDVRATVASAVTTGRIAQVTAVAFFQR